MPYSDRNKLISSIMPVYDATGTVIDLVVNWTALVVDDASGQVAASVGSQVKDPWGKLTAAQQDAVRALFAKLNAALA